MIYGTTVEKLVGTPDKGTVIPRIQLSAMTDGSNRMPSTRENPVFIQWNDGRKGWIQRHLLRVV